MSATSGSGSSFHQALCVVLLLSAGAQAQSVQSVTYDDNQLNLLQLTSNEPGEIVNCFQVYFPDAGFYAIVPDKPANGLEFTDQMRALAKNLANLVILTPGNYANDQYASGQLYGVEYDWFFPDATNQPSRPSLPFPMSVYLNPLGGGSAELFSKIYAFDQANYAVRKAAIEAVIGHPMETYTIWLGHAMLSTGGGLGAGVSISGTSNQMAGSIASTGQVDFTGALNDVSGSVSSAGSVDLGVSNTAGAVLTGGASPQQSAPLSVSLMRSLAISSGTYAQGSLTLDSSNIGSPGLFFAELDMSVNADDLSGDWTFVSASGNVILSGDGHLLEPAVGTTLAVAYLGDVQLNASNAQVIGESYAPFGNLNVTGSGNMLIGPMSADHVQVSGSANLLSDGTVQAP